MAADGAGNAEGPEGMLMRGLMDLLAQYEKVVIGSRTRAALAVKRARAQRVGSVPYGYRLADDGEHLEPERTERHAVALARELRASGFTLAAVGARLLAEGLRPRSGNPWHTQTVARIVAAEPIPSPV